MEDGVILRVQPRQGSSKSSWKQNFAKKFDLKQNGSRWKKQNRSTTNSGQTIQKKNPDPNGTWTCRNCTSENKPAVVRNNMKCPVHKVRPNYLKSIPLAGKINTVDQLNTNEQQIENLPGQFNSIKLGGVYGETDTE